MIPLLPLPLPLPLLLLLLFLLQIDRQREATLDRAVDVAEKNRLAAIFEVREEEEGGWGGDPSLDRSREEVESRSSSRRGARGLFSLGSC